MRYVLAVVAGLVLAAVASVTADGVSHYWTLTPTVAAPGDHVTDAIHDGGGSGAGTRGTDLYLILASRFTDGLPCSRMPGAIKVAVIVWTDNGLYHEGLAKFTVPIVLDGLYWLSDDVLGGSCRPSGFLTVSASRTPDTAMHHPASEWGALLTVAGLMVLVACASVARVRWSTARGRSLDSR